MANRRPYADVAADEALESRIATRRLVETINVAIRDGQIDDDECAAIDALTARALSASSDAVTATDVMANATRVAQRIISGPLDSEYLRSATRDAGYDPTAINEAIDETAAV